MTVILLDARQLKKNPDWLQELVQALEPMASEVVILDENGNQKDERERKKYYKEAALWVNLGHDLPRDFQEILGKGAITVMKEDVNPMFENYSPDQESGNSFLFTGNDKFSVFAAIVRALENHKFPYDWDNLKTESRKLAA
ncbi:MAG: hypothetical protein ABII07_02320 [Patescibacteria group bacterium]|nr:hypothetical protein [Patescibacteria group bacterium]